MPITHLVLGGGSHNGLNILGAIFQLKKKNFFQLENINTIYATSAGGIVATLLLLDMKEDTVIEYIVQRPWHKVIRIAPDTIINMLWKKGLLDKTFFYSLFSNLLATKDMTTSVTLLEFYQITNITLYICATRAGDMSPILFSHEKTPNLPLIDAIYMSAAMPMVFQPLFFQGHYIIDGDIAMNNPVKLCLDQGIKSDEILHIKIVRKENTLPEHDLNIFLYAFALFNNLSKKCKTDSIPNIKHTLIIPLNTLSVTEAKLALTDSITRKTLIENGRLCADLFIKFNSTE